MNCKKWLFSVLLFSSVSIGFSQTGPAGVGSSATNRFWLRADKLVGFNNGDPVNTWTDQSGNANNANGVNGPTYVLNGSAGLPAINFNGTTQHYTVTSLAALTQGEIFLVSKINNDPPAAGQSGLWRLGNSSNTHFPWINGNIYDEFGTNSRKDNIAVPPLNQLRIYNVRSASGNWANRLDGAVLFSTGSNTVSFSATPLIGQNASGNYFDGTMSEIILYNTVLNTAQRNIVENYLSSKYGVSIPTDKYLFESTHKFEVAGIGRDDASNIHNSAYSGATLGVASPSNLDDGEYLLFGNDNTSLAAWTTTEIPSANSNIQRVAREWKFDASGGSVGTVTVNIDPTKFPVLPSQYTTYYLMVDADGDFTSGATLYRINSSNQATGVTIADGAFATVACVRPVVQFTQTISNALENAGSATIQVSLNYASSALVTVPFTINGASTATGGGTDYSISASPISIAAGNLSANATITINNDDFVEPDETVILNMGSPTGAQAGTNSTHTFSINDDDNGFTIGFNTNTVAVNESTGTFNLTVQLNAATIPTVTVDYYVTSVTATGGIDYVLASGTATIVNPATTTTIPVIINEDALDEADETFVITLTNPINANLAGFNQLTFTIQDNDPAPTVAFSSATSAGSEAVGLASSVIQLSSVSGQDVVVNYAIADISATGGGVDYFVPASPITIPAGSTNFNLISIISEDVLIEGSETYSITLTGATGATLGATLTQTISISDNDNTGFVGPGGVGDATVNRLWIKADALVGFSDGQTVPTWTDVSGNSSSVTGVNSPAYRANVINGKPAIEFKASEADYYNLPNYTSLTQGEVFIITKINNDPPVASSTGLWRFGVSSNTHYPWVNGNLYDEFGTNVRKDNIAIPPLNQLRLYSVRSLPGSWVNRLDGTELFNTGSNTVSFSATPQLGINAASNYYDGLIPEVAFYSQALNTAQRNIVENYLAAKYNITIANDFYSFEAAHGNDVAGIGQVDATNLHAAAQSAKILKVSSPSDLGNNEYLLFGHDNAPLTWGTSETPNAGSNISRIAREWRFDQTGNVGSISVGADVSQISGAPYSTYILLVDADGNFASGASQYVMTNVGGSNYEASNISVPNQAFVTIAAIQPLVEFAAVSSSIFESTSPATLTVGLNYALSQSATVNYAVTGGTATGGGTDFTLASGTLTFPQNTTSNTINITIANDLVIEADETIIVTLSSPSAGVNLGANTVHTVTINDDDNTRKVSFNATTGSGSEGTTPVVMTVQISTPDASNPTTVDLTITGGTATAGVDAFLSPTTVTATIPANSLSTTVNLNIAEDALSEPNETVIVTMSNPTNSSILVGSNTFTYTITDNDLAPTAGFAQATFSGSEAVGVGNLQVSLTSISGLNTTINYTVAAATATGVGVDYTLIDGSIIIPAGQLSENIVAILTDDAIIEGSETFTVTLTGANVAGTTVATFTISDNDNAGFTGPGGVGDASVNRLWLKADALTGFTDTQTVGTWTDFSGNGSTVTGTNSPAYRTNVVNGKPAIEFRASEADYYNLPNYTSLSQGEVFIITKINNDPPVASSTGLWRFGVSSNTHYPWVNGNLYDEFGTNVRKDNIAIPPLNQLRLYSVRSLPGSWVNRLDGTELFNTGSNTVSFSATPQLGINAASNYYDGLIPEVVFYSQALNTAQRNIVENYLAAKYNINIANDFYNFDLTHGNEVAGIGQVDASNFHSAAESAGILKISSPSAMGNGEYLLFGHDNTSITAWNTTEIPASSTNIQRLTREWIANETGDLGNVTIGINSTLLPALPSQYSTYVLMVDADGDFTSSAVLYPMTNIAANQYEAVGINLANQSRLAIAIVRPLIQYTVSSSQSLEPTSPGVLTVQLNYPLERNVTVNYAVTGGSAIGGVDYVFANGTLTIPAGSTSSVQNITLINDILVEADETIIVQLSSPSTGVTLGAIDTHTFTINDDDNLRKVSFAPPVASSGAESVGTVVLTVLTSLVDASNPTTVDYSITGGTATSGVDAIASGTLTIPAGQPSATFNLSIIDDAINEANETVIITLTNPTNSNLNTTNTTYTYTINDDDVAPTVQFNNSTAIGAEPVVNALIQVSLSATSGQNVVVNYTVTPGTATSGVDYSLPSGSVTIPAGSSSVNIVAVVLDDVLIEGGEDFTVTITGATGATLGATLVNAVIISDNDNDGFTGPGGVGDATVMRFWLKASALTGFVDGQTVSSWTDFSGNSVSINAVNSPSYKLVGINSIPAIEFKASESDYYTLPSQSSLSQGEIFVVTMINNDPPSAGSSGLWHLGNSSSTHYPWTNGNLYDEFGTNVRKDNIPINPLNVPRIYNVRSQPNSWVSRLDGVNIFTTASNTVSFQASAKLGANAAPNYFDGLMPEVVLFNVGLNTAKRTIIENYLAAKYNTTIAVDKYQYQATHSSDVIGIGRDDALNLHIQSQSAGILTVGSPTNLGDGEYLMTGHDNGSIASWNSTNVPNTAFQRLARAWRVDETGGDVGSVVLTINKSSFPALPAGFDNYAVLVDNDGNFASGANILTPTFIDANNFQVTLNLTTGDVIAIAVVQNVTAQAGVFSTASTWTAGTVPLTGQNVIINHAVSLTSNASVGAMAIGATGSLSLGTSTLDITNGNLTIGVGGSLIANTGTVNYSQAGNQCVAPATYYNLTLSGTGIKTLCGNVSVGNTINFGSVVTLNTDVANNYSINLAGSWTGIGIFVPNTSTVTINGTALQTLNVSGLTFYNLVVNKPSADLQISSSITVTNALTLTRGDIILGGQNLILGNSATISAGSVSSYVQATGAGAIRKNFASTGSTMSFPVGDATLLTPLSINFASGTLSSAYVAVNLRNVVHPSVPNAGINRYWIVTPSGITSPNYTINYTYDQTDVITGGDETTYRPVKFNGALQSGTAADLDETTNTINWAGLTSFSDFTAESNAPLPVELLRFSGYFDNESNILEWATATELNNSYFEIQRSTDGAEFVKIGKVDGAGTTNLQQEYLYVDNSPYSGKNYYQLKQVDFDNKASYSKTIVVDVNSTPLLTVSVSPNPATGDRIIATIKGAATGKLASISVTDLNGKTISAASFTPTQVQNKIEFESSYMASGFYVVTVSQGTQVVKTKLIVAK